MTDKKKDKASGLISGIIVGGAIGSVLSLLFAPEKGKVTRKKVSDQGKVILGKSKSSFRLFWDRFLKKKDD